MRQLLSRVKNDKNDNQATIDFLYPFVYAFVIENKEERTNDSLIQFAVDKNDVAQQTMGPGFCWNWIDSSH